MTAREAMKLIARNQHLLEPISAVSITTKGGHKFPHEGTCGCPLWVLVNIAGTKDEYEHLCFLDDEPCNPDYGMVAKNFGLDYFFAQGVADMWDYGASSLDSEALDDWQRQFAGWLFAIVLRPFTGLLLPAG